MSTGEVKPIQPSTVATAIDRMEIPCKFDLELKSDGATRRQIVKRLHEIIFRIETLHRGVTGGGLFLENWKCESNEEQP